MAQIPVAAVPGVRLDLQLEPRTCHVVEVPLDAGKGMTLSVEQRGVDLSTTLIDPAGDETIVFDAPVRDRGEDAGAWIAKHSGVHRLEICAGQPESGGGYRLEVRYPLDPNGQLRARVAGFEHYARGQALVAQSKTREGRSAYERALESWRAADDPAGQAWAWTKIGGTAARLEEPEQAAEAYGRAAALFAQIGDRRSEANVALFRGNFLQKLYRFQGARIAYREARSAAAAVSDTALERAAIEGLGVSQAVLDEPLEALQLYRELLEDPRFAGDTEDRARALRWQGRVYLDLGQAERALELFGQALSLGNGGDIGSERAKLSMSLGGAELDLGHFAVAERSLEEARRLFEAGGDRLNLGWTLSRLGRLHLQIGRYPEARQELEKAQAIASTLRDDVMAAEVHVNRAKLASLQGDYDRAVILCRRALEGFTDSTAPLWSASALHCLADNLAGLGRLVDARRAIEKAIDRIETVRERPGPGSLRGALLADRHEYYGLLIDILLRLYAAEGDPGLAAAAFEVAERSRSRTLLDEMERATREISDRSNPELLARAEDAAAEIDELEGRLLREKDSLSGTRAEELRGRLEDLRATRDLVEGQIAEAFPGATVTSMSAPVDLATIQKSLLGTRDVQILEYFLGESQSTVWIIGPDSLSVQRLPDRKTIEALARQTAHLMAESDQRHKRLQARLAAEALSGQVVEPVSRALTAPHLVVIADGALNGVPFAALPIRAAEDAPLLGERFEVTNLPSASVGVALRNRRRPPPRRGELAILADPVFTPDDPRLAAGGAEAASPATVASLTRAAGLDGLPRLTATRKEAEAIARLVPPDRRRVLLDFDAARRSVLAGAVSGYRIVHVATHGLVLGKLSGLVLSQVDRDGRPVDGFLRSWELYGLGLRADLVVLSACRTGLGHYLEGEGVMGLSRAFLAAGASQVLVSLWDVDDRATAVLMERFYTELLVHGLAPGEALRKAQRWVREDPEWSASHYWAGFVLQGSPP